MRLKDVMKLYNAIVYTSTFNERSNGTDYRIVVYVFILLFVYKFLNIKIFWWFMLKKKLKRIDCLTSMLFSN